MIGGFVDEKEVGAGVHHANELDEAFFSAGKCGKGAGGKLCGDLEIGKSGENAILDLIVAMRGEVFEGF